VSSCRNRPVFFDLGRCNVSKLFNGKGGNLFSTSRSTCSSSSSGFHKLKKNMNEERSPCMVFTVEPIVEVLCTSTFNGVDVNNKDVDFYDLDREFILKRLIAVSENPSIVGQRSISAVERATGAIVHLSTYLILEPIIVMGGCGCGFGCG